MKRFLYLPLIMFLCLVAGMAGQYFISTGGSGAFDFVTLIQGPVTSLVLVVGTGSFLIYALTHALDKKEKPKLGSKTKEGKDLPQYFDSHWVTEKELQTQKQFMFCTWETLNNMKDGILIRSQVKNNRLNINMYHPIHTMIIGTTGVGKTQKYIEPSIQILSSTRTKPSMVITDPKSELYEHHANKLRSEGYDVKAFNLRKPYESARWNPMENSFNLYHDAFNLYEKVITHEGVNPADLKLRIIADEYNNEWYEFGGVAYPNKESLDSDLSSKKAEMIDSAENELREIATNLCPIEPNKPDQSWDRGAQEFIYGTMLAMLEDSMNPELGMTKEKFNFYNLAKICSYKDPDPENPYRTLRQYYTGRSKFSKVLSLVSTAVNNAPVTTKSYMGIVTAHMSIFNDNGMCFATSANEIDFSNFSEKPTALFIIFPDEKISRHSIVTLMISQTYKRLIELASTYPNSKLPRNCYFLLDEFANLPKIDKIDSIVTVSRSRNIFFSLVVQSYSQLNSKYGADIADTLKSNCAIKIFIGTDDAKTCEEFSKLCGDVTLQTTSMSESKQKDKEGKETPNNSTSTSMTSRPLIYPDELRHLSREDGTGEMIVNILNEFPIRTLSNPYWQTVQFDHTHASDNYVIARSLNEEEVAYSIAERNDKVLRPKRPFGTPLDF
jgi:type IV secretion system protein VirD4